MKKTFAACLLLLICGHSAHIGAAPQKGEAPRAWLSDQVMRSRTSGNSGVEADALARLLSMDPNDPATKLELLRMSIRMPVGKVGFSWMHNRETWPTSWPRQD